MASYLDTPVLVVSVEAEEDFVVRQAVPLFGGNALWRPSLQQLVVVLVGVCSVSQTDPPGRRSRSFPGASLLTSLLLTGTEPWTMFLSAARVRIRLSAA